MRIRINLLPHREARRERQKKSFYALTALSVVAGALLVGLVWSILEGYIGSQSSRNDMIEAENKKLDVQIREIATLKQEIEGLRSRQKAVEDLQADRNQPVYLMDELTKLTPEGIYLKSIKQEDKKVNVTGWAASNERVSEFLRNLQNNGRYLERPDLVEIKIAQSSPQGIQRRLFDFSLNFTMKATPNAAAATPGQPAKPAPKPVASSAGQPANQVASAAR